MNKKIDNNAAHTQYGYIDKKNTSSCSFPTTTTFLVGPYHDRKYTMRKKKKEKAGYTKKRYELIRGDNIVVKKIVGIV